MNSSASESTRMLMLDTNDIRGIIRSESLLSISAGDDDGSKRSKTQVGDKYKAWALANYGSEKICPIVHCKVKIYRLSNFDTISMTVIVDFVLMMDWIDESVIEYGQSANLDDHFSPYVRIHNAKDDNVKPVDFAKNRLQDDPKIPGHVKRTERYRCTLFVKDINLQRYPFDNQYLKIELKGDHVSLRSARYVVRSDGGDDRQEDKAIRSRSNGSGEYRRPNETCPRPQSAHSLKEADNSNLSGWEMLGFGTDALTPKSSGDLLEISVEVKRNPFGLVMILVVPLVICIILSMTSFVLEPQKLSERLQITVTMLLAAAAFHQQARGHIPPNLPYTTVLDKYMLTTLVILLMQAFVHVLIASVNESEVVTISGGSGPVNAIDALFMCHCLRDISFPNCQPKTLPTRTNMHRFTYFAFILALSLGYYVKRRAGSLKSVAIAASSALFRIIKTSTVYIIGAMCIVLIMAVGTRPSIIRISTSSWESFTDVVKAIFYCMEGHCIGMNNPSLCAPPVQSLLMWLLSDEMLVEIMMYSILFVHLVLWVEFLM